jgi:hypothetical protein
MGTVTVRILSSGKVRLSSGPMQGPIMVPLIISERELERLKKMGYQIEVLKKDNDGQHRLVSSHKAADLTVGQLSVEVTGGRVAAPAPTTVLKGGLAPQGEQLCEQQAPPPEEEGETVEEVEDETAPEAEQEEVNEVLDASSLNKIQCMEILQERGVAFTKSSPVAVLRKLVIESNEE